MPILAAVLDPHDKALSDGAAPAVPPQLSSEAAPVAPTPPTVVASDASPAFELLKNAPPPAVARPGGERGIFGLRKALQSAVRVLTTDIQFDVGGTRGPAQSLTAPDATTVAPAEPAQAIESQDDAAIDDAPIDDAAQESERPAGLSGHTSTVAMPELLGFLAQLRKTGTLWIWNDREQFLVQLVDGNVTFARSQSPRQGSLLGEILISQGAIDGARFDAFLAAPREPGPLGDALVKAGLVSREALASAIQYQAQRVFDRAYGLADAYFCFEGGVIDGPREGTRISVTHMLFESARTRDESEQRLESVLGDPFAGE